MRTRLVPSEKCKFSCVQVQNPRFYDPFWLDNDVTISEDNEIDMV